MGQYTESRNIAAETLSIDDDDFKDKLQEIAKKFRGFDDALTEFIVEHGYTGPASDVDAKAQFLRDRFKAKGIKQPRNLKKWFVPVKKLDRDTLYQVCFAFKLNVAETEDFFRRICFARSFDCHTVKEAVYYYCIKNNRSYAEANQIIEQIPKLQKVKTLPEGDAVLYTQTIVHQLDEISDPEKLIQYITSNIDSFGYNNVTASKDIQELWKHVVEQGGLADKDAHILYRYEDFGKNEGFIKDNPDYYEADMNKRLVTPEEEEDNVASHPVEKTTWNILSQILGLTINTEREYADKHDRSLLTAFSGNVLMPLRAAYCFPNRQNIEKIIRGELIADYEAMRKILILLKFYSFWADKDKIYLNASDDETALERHPDSARCLYDIDSHLASAGYPILYAGNPYDWIFMWSLNSYDPLEAFRTYMNEVFMEASSQNQT